MRCHINVYHVTSMCVMSHQCVSCHISVYHVTSMRVMSHRCVSCHINVDHVTSTYVMSHHCTSRHAILRHILSLCFMLPLDSDKQPSQKPVRHYVWHQIVSLDNRDLEHGALVSKDLPEGVCTAVWVYSACVGHNLYSCKIWVPFNLIGSSWLYVELCTHE